MGYTEVMSTVATYRQPRRRPGHESLEKLLVAAEDQLRQEELGLFTVDRVLERAGVSIGSFYARFPTGKDALLHAVQDRFHQRRETVILESLEDLHDVTRSLEDAVDRAFTVLVDHAMRDRELTRAFMMFSAFDPQMRQKGMQVNLERRRAVAAVLAPYRTEIPHPDPDAAINVAYSMYLSVVHGRLMLFPPHGASGPGGSDEDVFAQIQVAIRNYLCGNDRGGSQEVGEAQPTG